MRIALVCDWLTGMRGGERCLKAVADLYPRADLFALVYFPGQLRGEFEGRRVITSFIQKLPVNDRSFRYCLPLFPAAVESFDLRDYELVVSFSHCAAKGARARPGAAHLCYCHTPVRYAWDLKEEYLRHMNILLKRPVSAVLDRLRRWDLKTSGRVTRFIANSVNIQRKIQRFYGRSSEVIHPPVELERFSVSDKEEDYYLAVSAMVPYKRLDIAVEAFNETGQRLIIAGSGPEYRRLRAAAKSNIEFIAGPDDAAVEQLYAGCRALIFPGEEDFGIVPLEAQACGKPVVAYGRGGVLETVIPLGRDEAAPTGVFFEHPSVESLKGAIRELEKNRDRFRPEYGRRNAERFGTRQYQARMQAAIESVTAGRDSEADRWQYSHQPSLSRS